jgi:hypothetical protein
MYTPKFSIFYFSIRLFLAPPFVLLTGLALADVMGLQIEKKKIINISILINEKRAKHLHM